MIDDHSPALRAFHTIARHGSFTRAAAELEVTPSALSQAMRQLEQRMGARLLQRSTRKVGLTEAGRQFLERIGPALAEIDGAVEALRQHGDHPAGTLRITAPHSLLDQLLAPMLADFLRAYPDVTLDLIADNALTDLVADGVDAGIRLGERLARDFLPAADAGGLLPQLDRWVMARSLALLQKRRAESRPVRLFVSQAPRTLAQDDYAAWLVRSLQQSSIEGTSLVIDLRLEDALVHSMLLRQFCEQLVPAGVQFCLSQYRHGPDAELLLQQLPLGYLRLSADFAQQRSAAVDG